MSGVIERAVGDKLKLTLQLHDGVDTMPKRVFCTLKDEDYVDVVASFEIPHVGGGVFQETDETMPNIDTLFAYFLVTEDDGVTPSLEHTQEHDRYERVVPLDLSSVEIKPFNLIGNIQQGAIEGKITSDNRLVGFVRDEDGATGIISGDEIQGEVDGNNIKGEL